MDSCHIFNFIFGTRKATTELSKCFSNIGENVRGSRAAPDKLSPSSSPEGQQQSPKSPLKQLQNKLVHFVSKVQKHASEEPKIIATPASSLDSKAELVSIQSGTYKATLVRSSSDDFEEQSGVELEDDNCRVVVNPIHDMGSSTIIEIVENPLPQQYEGEYKLRSVKTDTEIQKDKHIIKDGPEEGERKNYNKAIDYEQVRVGADRIVLFEEEPPANQEISDRILSGRKYKRSMYVRNLVRSIESGSVNLDESRRPSDEAINNDNNNYRIQGIDSSHEKGIKENKQNLSDRRGQPVSNIFDSPPSKPMTLVKPLPPKAPPKSFKAKCIRHQLSLNKPSKLQQLFQDERFLARFFDSLEPLERCAAAQVCRKWRDILYSDHKYWKGLINVIDCTQLRREHLVECIVNTLHSAKVKQQYKIHDMASSSSTKFGLKSINQQSGGVAAVCFEQPSLADDDLDEQTISGECKKPTLASDTIYGFDQEDVWRIQELCNRYALQKYNHSQFKPQLDSCAGGNQSNSEQQHQQICSTSKSSSIPSQISSTFSSASLSSILSPLSESSRVETMKEKLYTSIDSRGFNAICLFGATDDDIEDLVCKIPSSSHERITIGRLNNCSITNSGLDTFITSFRLISELELTGCNELSNAFDLSPLTELKRLIITDCINIADGLAQKLIQILPQLTDLTIQAYHLTDAFIEFLSMNCETSKLQRLELPNCKEITNQSVIVLAKHFSQLELLSISGSTKISDDGIEILAEQVSKLKSLDLSWCPRVTDASLECIACELGDSLTELVLDRNVNITDIGLGYLASMNKLNSLQIRWCARITDTGVESLIGLRSLRYLSLAGLHQVTARSLLGLVNMNLVELELTNCPAVNVDLVMFLSTKLSNCNIIF